jgi:hypothetical protein
MMVGASYDECYIELAMKTYVHVRLCEAERNVLKRLTASTGQTESEILRRGLQLVSEKEGQRRSALALTGPSVGRFKNGPRDLSTNRKHLEGFGKTRRAL